MPTEDIVAGTAPVNSLMQDVVGAVAGATIDLTGYDGCELILSVGPMGGSAGPTINGQWEDSPDGAVWTAIASANLTHGGAIPQLTAANQSTLFKRGYDPVGALGQRYVRWNVTAVGGTTPSQPQCAMVLRGDPRSLPTPDTA